MPTRPTDADEVDAVALRRISMELAALSESGLAYCRDHFDIGRFHRIGELADELLQLAGVEGLRPYDPAIASVAGYTTPKLDVRGGLFDEAGRVLLVREVADDGRWTLPGGWCDVLESPRRAIEREVLEEAGVTVEAGHLAAVVDRELWPHQPAHDRHSYKLFFVCTPTGAVDTGYTSDETSGLGWFAVDDLPELSVDRVVPGQIRLLHEHWRRPGPAHVD
ncbi:NUDIX hydrolase N-terminal domain-containing protein [Kytococcus sedentarius]|uniref:ADP-ribose pyrophosphatase n=1 Tax=Kytococcus sedentarius (strain ATCC 14392 / DSM 20547 / JCM 11482 / CCUG 33030 / NBRC 15357 / NCTC 11040 / CCM 314 / 541) TaxID=478801 RepID=C7NHR2_KYTSD|nr:NUDIX hydrolase N-terminal domain-containing protein [Kytococcus sedentarius]ACV06419.1 ADP-ribose pyrophosphatase [Kytococcus sedentarius DSM 20547]QQB64740.1 NUDIX hydrolase N-terminal domain-containing protein [Kytococcus sedentarius]STX12159.1 NTP pyrophosphohydrolases containing a Zn-finger, probably nucleic-acid-binding [Kytococcus sedentarius]